MILREIALASLVGVLIVLWGAIALIRRWGRKHEAERQRKLPAALRKGH